MYLSHSNCIIEIPFKPIKVNGIPKYKHLSFNNPIMFSNKTKINTRFLTEEGNAVLASNYLFVAKVKIGSNKQEFNLILDSGSIVTWVAAQGSNDIIPIAHHFNPSASSTCSKTILSSFHIKYENEEEVSGNYYIDNFYYINDKAFKLVFGLATQTYFSTNVADGIIGLGHSYESNAMLFIHMINFAGISNSESFSLKFGNNIEAGASGKLIIGKHDDFSKNNLASCPVKKGDYLWICQLNGFGLKTSANEIKTKKSYNVIFDTGANFIFLPMDYFNEIDGQLQKINCISITNEAQDKFQIICRAIVELPNFTFEINGNTLVVPNYYAFTRKGQYYFSNIIFTKSEKYIIGIPFFLSYHTLFDKENEKLVFYPEQNINKQLNLENSEKIIDKNNLFSYTHIIIIISSILFCIGLISLIYYSIRKMKTIKRMDNIENKLLSK